MSNPVTKFEVKSHHKADELRTPNKTRIEIVHLEGYTFTRITKQPGWRWSECIKPLVHTESCQNAHVGYVVSGRLAVVATDGTTKRIGPGESYTIPPGHDAWVEGDEPYVCIEVQSARADTFAKPQ